MLSMLSKAQINFIFLQLYCLLLSINFVLSAQEFNKSKETVKTTSYFKRDAFGSGTYAFGYEINDKESGNLQFRDERRYSNGTIVGSYGHLQPDGSIAVTHYVADNTTGYHTTLDTYESSTNLRLASMNKKVQQKFPQNVTEDKQRRLNITSTKVPTNISDSLMNQFDINTNLTVLPDALVDPLINSILNGSALEKIEVTTVRNLFPTTFPLVPFVLPQNNLTTVATKITKDTELPNPKPLISNDTAGDTSWYEQIIQQNRKEFLDKL